MYENPMIQAFPEISLAEFTKLKVKEKGLNVAY